MAVCIFRRRAQNTKIGKKDFLIVAFIFAWPTNEEICSNFSEISFKIVVQPPEKFDRERIISFRENKSLRLVQPISQPNLGPCSLG